MLLVVVAPLISRATAQARMDSFPQAVTAHAGHHMGMQPASAPPAEALHMHHDMEHGMGRGMDHAMPLMPVPVDGHTEHEMGVDCEYCLIAARMITLLVALLPFLTVWPPVFRALAGLVNTRRAPLCGTLGARGPPSGIAC